METAEQGRGLPLAGLRVVAIEQYISAPYCTMLLADAGAEVIKIEQPGGGDPRRTIGPFAPSTDGHVSTGGFLSYNRNKKSLTLDLKQPSAQRALRELIARSDVVVENLRPGALEKLGISVPQLLQDNERLIYAAISGFGRMGAGPYAQRPAFDIVVEAMSGIMNIVGFADREPLTTLYGLPDTYTGLVAAYNVALALIQRGVSGKGQLLDIAMYDCMIALNERSVMNYSYSGVSPVRGAERVAGPRGAFKAVDGYVALSCPTDLIWSRLARLMDREDLIDHPDTRTAADRAAAEPLMREVIEAWLADKTRDEATDLMMAAGVPAGPVQTMEDVFSCPHVAARGTLLEVEDGQGERRRMAKPATAGSRMAHAQPLRPPRLGEHNEEILGGVLGYSAAQLEELVRSGVICPKPD